MKLTKSKVDNLLVPDVPVFHWDSELRGFGIKIMPSGKRIYVVQGRVSGKSKRITLGTHGVLTCDEARKKAREVLVLFSGGIDPKAKQLADEAGSLTLREVAEDYCLNRKTKKGGPLKESTKSDIRRHIDTSFEDWADHPIVNITTTMVRARFEKLSANTPTQANQAFRNLRALINFSADAENPRFNPVQVLSKKKLWNKDNRKTGYIPLDKIGPVWNWLQEQSISPAHLPVTQTSADITIFILLTGCRWSEAAKLTWDCVNLENGHWFIGDPKNHNAITFPLPLPLIPMLKGRPHLEQNNYVFPSRDKKSFLTSARNTMKEISILAGLRLTPHDLRRTFIQMGIKLKIEMWKLKLLTNHIAKGDVTIDHYTETSDLRYLTPEIEQIAAWLEEQGKIAAASNVVQLKVA